MKISMENQPLSPPGTSILSISSGEIHVQDHMYKDGQCRINYDSKKNKSQEVSSNRNLSQNGILCIVKNDK